MKKKTGKAIPSKYTAIFEILIKNLEPITKAVLAIIQFWSEHHAR